MPIKNNQLSFRLVLVISAMILAVTPALQGCKKKPSEQTHIENNPGKTAPPAPVVKTPPKPEKSKPDAIVSPKTAEAPALRSPGEEAPPKADIRNVIRAARTWGPAYTSWVGQKAPDFTLTDINGKQHKLSDYRGKDVLIIFWATWCGPCIREVPHLLALRNTIGEDKLVILAISYTSAFPRETPEKVKAFVEQNKINYTVFSVNPGLMPSPFNRISSIPCSFFIDPEGKIKLATEGLISLNEIKAVLQAKW